MGSKHTWNNGPKGRLRESQEVKKGRVQVSRDITEEASRVAEGGGGFIKGGRVTVARMEQKQGRENQIPVGPNDLER